MTLTNHLKLRHLAHSEACLGGFRKKKIVVKSAVFEGSPGLKIKKYY